MTEHLQKTARAIAESAVALATELEAVELPALVFARSLISLSEAGAAIEQARERVQEVGERRRDGCGGCSK